MGLFMCLCLKFIWLFVLTLSPAVEKPNGPRTNPRPQKASTEDDPAMAAQARRLAEILKQWEQHSAKRTRLDCRFKRYRYDSTFSIEYQGEGHLALDRAGRAAYVLSPTKVPPRAAGRKRNVDGEPYTLRADAAQRWYWTDTEVIRIEDDRVTMQLARRRNRERIASLWPQDRPLPPELPRDPEPLLSTVWWDDEHSDFFLPEILILGGPTERLKQYFQVTLINEADMGIFLELHPTSVFRKQHFQHVRLVLDKNQFIPIAILYESPGRDEIVHRFMDVQVSGSEGPPKSVHFLDLGAPDLSRLKKFELATP